MPRRPLLGDWCCHDALACRSLAHTLPCIKDPDGDGGYGYAYSYPTAFAAYPGPASPAAAAASWYGYCYAWGGGYGYRFVHYVPKADTYGEDQFSFAVQDWFGAKGTVTAQVSVLPVNDAPSFVAGPNVTAGHNAGPQSIAWAGGISAGPFEEGQPLAFIVTTDQPGLFSEGPAIAADGTLSFTPDQKGTATVAVQLCDAAAYAPATLCTAAATFTITLEPGKQAAQAA